MNNNLAQIHPDETIQITNSALDQPMSTSVLTVTETAEGTYHFQCQVDLEELGVKNMSNEYSISITRFCKLHDTYILKLYWSYCMCTCYIIIPAVSTNITGETNPLAAEKYTLTCMITVTGGIPDNSPNTVMCIFNT